MSLISIDQLLESVDLDFEPRFVTKNEGGRITIWKHRPKVVICAWISQCPEFGDRLCIDKLKLSEFEGKDWTECIYEVPQNTNIVDKKIEKLKNVLMKYSINDKEYETYASPSIEDTIDKINELIDMVNELNSQQRKSEVTHITLYTCSDGVTFDNKDAANAHELHLRGYRYDNH